MQESDNILRILEGTKKAIQSGDGIEIKNLSDQTTNTASLTQDPDNIAVAVIVYSIGKILERGDYQSLKGWDTFYRNIVVFLDKSIEDIGKNNEKGFRKDFEIIRKSIGKLSGKLKKYIQEVFRKASINKASRIHEHGISMETTASLLGITMFEIASYTGQTGISDVPISRTLDIKSRLKTAMEMFE